MAYYKLIREIPDGKAVHGNLYLVQHAGLRERLTHICETLENADKLVPALIYRVAVTNSPKFKRPLPVLQQVPGRTGIRFHRGTKPEHSKGCILVSAADELVLTAKWLKEQHDHEEIRLEFC
jgi:hypothetical protein